MEHENVIIDPSVLEYVILELLSLFANGTEINGELKIALANNESDWYLTADFTPAEDSTSILQSLQDAGSCTSLAASLLALNKFGGRVELSANDQTVGWKLTIPLEKGKK